MSKIYKSIIIVFLILLSPILIVAALVGKLLSSPIRMSREEVADIIERFINGKAGDYEWDDFICIPIQDKELDSIRRRCAVLDEEFPPGVKGHYTNNEGMLVLHDMLKTLRN